MPSRRTWPGPPRATRSSPCERSGTYSRGRLGPGRRRRHRRRRRRPSARRVLRGPRAPTGGRPRRPPRRHGPQRGAGPVGDRGTVEGRAAHPVRRGAVHPRGDGRGTAPGARCPVERFSADAIWEASEGNPLFLRHLVEGALDGGTLRRSGGVWQLRGRPGVSAALASLLESRFARTPRDALDVVDYLAFCEPLELEVLSELVSRRSIEEPSGWTWYGSGMSATRTWCGSPTRCSARSSVTGRGCSRRSASNGGWWRCCANHRTRAW